MDIRVLRYFLTVAHEGNFTRAASRLHITQPTLSRQIRDLENELGTELLIRGGRQITLTESGILFQQRAKEMLSLIEKTQRDLSDQSNLVGGVVAIGCVETIISRKLPELIASFSSKYPMVQYELYGADGDDIREKLDRGSIDLGILLEPVETAKYDYVRLPIYERWGILARSDDVLSQNTKIGIEELRTLPLIAPRRQIVQDEISKWLDEKTVKLQIVATHNLLTNASLLVKGGIGYLICVEGAFTIRPSTDFAFIPFAPERKTGHVVAWRKNQILTNAAERFISAISNTFQA